MQVREKVEKSRSLIFSKYLWLQRVEKSKSRLAKAAGAEPVGQMRDEQLHAAVVVRTHISKSKCTQHVSFGALFGSCDVEKVHAVVARSTFWSQNVQSTSAPERFWKLRCSKVHAVVARTTFRSPNVQNTTCSRHFWTLQRRFVWQAQGSVHLFKSEQNVRVSCISKNDGRRVTFEEDLQRYIFCGRRNTRDMFIRDVRRSGRWFPERCCILEHQIFRFAKVILCDRCSTLYDLASLIRGRRSTLDRWSGKIANALVRGRQLCIQLSILEGSLAEFFRFWCCQL